MVSDIDQFGRDTSKNDTSSLKEEKSKKILDSLAEIKNQLENKNYNPNVEESIPKTKVSNTKNNSNYEELKLKIESLEEKLNSIDTFINNKSKNIKVHEPIDQKLDRNLSIFHQIDNHTSIQKNKSLLVLKNENDFNRSNYKFFHFIMTISILFLLLVGLIIYIKNIPLKDILKIF